MTNETAPDQGQAEANEDRADLEERDRAQPNLVTREANLRADGNGEPERDERGALLDAVEEDD